MSYTTETLEVLEKARELIARPGGWTQNAYARSDRNRQVKFEGKAACRFCLLGAIRRVCPSNPFRFAEATLVPVLGCRSLSDLTAWNDAEGQTQAEVVDLFTRAIAAVREQIGGAA